MNKLCIINVVGMTPELLQHAPVMSSLGQAKAWKSPLPAVTCTSQATMLTGKMPNEHGIVGNGWLFRDTQEVRFWQQANSLIQGELLYENIKTAKMFWWYNLGAKVDFSVTPRPHYGSDGSKAFGIIDHSGCKLEEKLGPFPFPAFWGPAAGLASSRWIAESSQIVMREQKPDCTLVYLPHLDYDYQRFTPGNPERVKEVDDLVGGLKKAADDIGAQVIVVSEYGLVPVNRAVMINRVLREQGWLVVRDGPYGEMLQPHDSRVFAVCDHQLAHLYVRDVPKQDVIQCLEKVNGIDQVVDPETLELNHERSGELIALSKEDAWFAYPYWLNDERKPDFATSVDIHRKPGYDPCELFMSSKLNAGISLAKKILGFRYRFNVVPLDTSLVKGSHGLHPSPDKGPLIIGPGALPEHMKDFKKYVQDLI